MPTDPTLSPPSVPVVLESTPGSSQTVSVAVRPPRKRGRPKGVSTTYFRSVQQARELLMRRAQQILQDYLAVIEQARQQGDVKVAAESLRWLLSHLPEANGVRVIDSSVDRPPDSGQGAQTQVTIGIALAGVSPEALPAGSSGSRLPVVPSHDA